MDEAKKYSITILGTTYSIRSDESEQHIQQACLLLDTYAKNCMEKTRTIDQKTTLLLVALQLATELIHSNNRYESSIKALEHMVAQINNELSVAV